VCLLSLRVLERSTAATVYAASLMMFSSLLSADFNVIRRWGLSKTVAGMGDGGCDGWICGVGNLFNEAGVTFRRIISRVSNINSSSYLGERKILSLVYLG